MTENSDPVSTLTSCTVLEEQVAEWTSLILTTSPAPNFIYGIDTNLVMGESSQLTLSIHSAFDSGKLILLHECIGRVV